MRSLIVIPLVLAMVGVSTGTLNAGRAEYVGGTAPMSQGVEGQLDLSGPVELVFSVEGSSLKIPYERVTSLDYGVKKLGAPLGFLFPRKKHILTIGYTEEGKSAAAVFELAKESYEPTLATLQARTGVQVELEAGSSKARAAMQRSRTAQTRPRQVEDDVEITNSDVARMVRAGVEREVILTAIRKCQPRFSLYPGDLEALANAGVPPEIIKAMAARVNGQ
jgi:hypothetical protein